MRSNPFVQQRQQLDATNEVTSVVATLPSELRETNAVPLMSIVRELEASSVIELGVIHAVTRVNVEDPQAVKAQRVILEDYRDRRLYDRDRTHCSNLKRIATQLRSADESPKAVSELGGVDQALEPLMMMDADDDLLKAVEEVVSTACAAIAEIDECRRVADAEAAQVRFAQAMRPTIKDIKDNLGRMNELASRLIDAM